MLFVCALVGIVMSRSGDPEAGPAPAVVAANAAAPDGPTLSSVVQTADAEPNAALQPEPERDLLLEAAPVIAPVGEEPAEPRPTVVPVAAATDGIEALLARARELTGKGNTVEARRILSEGYLECSGRDAQAIRKLLDPICEELVFNPRNTDIATIYEVQPGDNMVAIGRKLKVPWRLILRLNGMTERDARSMRVGRQLKVLAGKPSIVVWKGEFRMALLLDGLYVKEYPIGTGRNNKTPTGVFVVNNTMIHAPWTAPDGKVYQYGDEGYQLGERWIAFEDQPGASGLGIHGTHDESSIGTMCSNGCLRMRNADVVELYDFVRHGTKVTIME